MVSHWQTSDFLKLKSPVKMSEYDLGRLQISINSYIDRWVASNPYKNKNYAPSATKKVSSYIAENFVKQREYKQNFVTHRYSQKDLALDIQLTYDLYFASMERLYLEFKKANPGKSITEISRKDFSPDYIKIESELGIGRHLMTALNPKYVSFFNKESLQKSLNVLTKWHLDHFEGLQKRFEFGNRKTGLVYDRYNEDTRRLLSYYQKALQSIYNYAGTKGIDLTSQTPDVISLIEGIKGKNELVMNHYQIIKWDADTTKAYHIIYHLTKYLGFDPMTFTALDNNIFEGGTKAGQYRRHNFLALMFRKMSTQVNDIVLTSATLHHAEYETFLTNNGIAAEAYIKLLMQSLSEMVDLKDANGNYIKFKESHMKEILYKNFGAVEGQKILDKWKGVGPIDFAKNLRTFNERRRDAFNGDYKKFLNRDYGNAYSAYYNKVNKITFTQILATQSNLDFLSGVYGLPFRLRPVQITI